MATADTASTAVNPSSPVPLDTIPISPAKENTKPNMSEDEIKATNGSTKFEDEVVTVFHDQQNFNVKHPLMNEWTLWFTKPPSGKVRSPKFGGTPRTSKLTSNYRATTGMIC